MGYTLQQIYAALAAVEKGPEMLVDLQNEISNLRAEAGNYRTSRKKVLDALGLKDSDDIDTSLNGLKSTLTALRQSGNNPDELGVKLADLTRKFDELTEKYNASEKKANEERAKRLEETKLSQALAALQEGNAVSPAEVAKIVLNNIQAKDDDSLVYLDGDKELTIAEGVKQYLAANPWAVANKGQPGSGANGSAVDSGGVKKFSIDELKSMTPEQINAHWAEIEKGGIDNGN